MKFSAFIPIKLSSERVPNKNFTLINNKPLFFYILKTLKSVKSISQIVIDADDQAVIDEIKKYFDNLDIFIRNPKLLSPVESVNNIINSNLENFKNETVIQTHVTNPLLHHKTLKNALNEYADNKKAIFSVNALQSRFYNSKLEAINHNPDELIPTQDLDIIYEENSNFYIFSKDQFIKNNNKRLSSESTPFVTSTYESIDIDNQEDLEIVKKIINYK
jgi:CMP-N-acetylneuraminic acid synthetase|tara:strand:+ start:738 stop:1391 length:654 start_codon:yes stop_codon:yes gene_type:complete